MKIETLEYESAKERIKDFDYALVYYISSTELFKTAQADIEWEECQEARFFSETTELRFFRDGFTWIASMVADEEGDKIVDETYKLAGRFSSLGENVKVREYFVPDDDGQMAMISKRLVSIS